MRLKLEQEIINIVSEKRKSLPREDVRKLVKLLHNAFNKANLKIVEIRYLRSLENIICSH